MQRWIIVALVGAILFGLGGGYALWTYRENRPRKVWVPLALNETFPAEKRDELAGEIKKKLLEDATLAEVVKDTGLTAKLGLSSDSEATEEVRKRLFVEVGEADVPNSMPPKRVPSINIGLNAQRKSYDAFGEVAMRLMEDVWKMLGIKKPQGDSI